MSTFRRRLISLQTCGITINNAPNGIYIYSTDGLLYTLERWNTNNNAKVIGIALISDSCRLCIAPDESTKKYDYSSSPLPPLVLDIVTTTDYKIAWTDFNGKDNTLKAIMTMGDKANAPNYCVNYKFKNGVAGYLMSAGEALTLKRNEVIINKYLTAIGGDRLGGDAKNYLTSTQYDTDFVWASSLNKNVGESNSLTRFSKLNGAYVRVICPLL